MQILLPLLAFAAWSYACYCLGKWHGRRDAIASKVVASRELTRLNAGERDPE